MKIMYQLLDQSSGSVVGIQITEKLTKEDYESLIPLWENAIQEHGKNSCALANGRFPGLES